LLVEEIGFVSVLCFLGAGITFSSFWKLPEDAFSWIHSTDW
jgi:hypothetical protein